MKLHVVFDQDGRILAAAKLDPKAPVRARPMPDEDHRQRAADVDVPSDYRRQKLDAICETMMVDTRGKHPQLMTKESNNRT
jgi:hypothetical protein